MLLAEDIIDTMIEQASNALQNAYHPYTKMKVGACLLASDGTLYTGANVEIASYSLSNSAEQTAVFKAVSDQNRKFDAILIVGEDDAFYPPSGNTCQVLSEFDIQTIILANNKGRTVMTSLGELAPSTIKYRSQETKSI